MQFLRSAEDRRQIVLDRLLRSYVTVESVELTTLVGLASGWAGPLSSITASTTAAASAIRVDPADDR